MSNPFIKLKDSIKRMANNPSFTLKEQFGYASGRFGNEMGQDVVGTFLTMFLAKYVGIEVAVITVLMGIARALNIFCDPVAGTILDRGFGRGRRNVTKPILLLTPFPIAVTSILLFIIPAQGMTFRLIWVFCFYLIYTITDNFYDMSLSTMSVRMCSNPKDRKNFYTLAQFAASLGTTLPAGLIPIFVSIYKENFAAQGYVYLIAGTVFGILGLAAMLVPYFTLKERNPSISIKKPKVALNAKALLSNKPMILVTGAELAESIRKICYGALPFFYLETLGAFWLSTVVGAVSVVLNYIGMLLVPFIGKKVSPRNMMVYGYLYSGICYLLLLLVGYQSLWIVGILIA
ncbi:MAG: MFS transporter, partial [Clostridia bacterium]|nr:MFS transporter [Clostridia bacterium]